MDSPSTAPKLAFAAVALGRGFARSGCSARQSSGPHSRSPSTWPAAPLFPGRATTPPGVAAVLALMERFAADPLPDVEVIAVLTGCEESGMGGMGEWMRTEGKQLDPPTTLVLGLDTLGAGEPIVVRGEGSIWPWRYRDADLDWADRGAARVGMATAAPGPAGRLDRSDCWPSTPVSQRVSLLSATGNRFTNYHQPTDTPDRVDWDSVAACLTLANGIIEEWAESG